MSFNKILLAGATGFLGKSVAQKLTEEGLPFVSVSLEDGADFRDFEKTRKLFEQERFDAVINCAAFVGGIEFGYKHPGEVFFNNILMATYLMESARLAGVKLFVNPISNCTYPGHLTMFKEEEWWSGSLHESVLPYGFARKASWVQAWAYHKQYGFNSTNLIFSNMYGPRDYFDEVRSHALTALVMKFVEAKRKNLPEVIVWGSGQPVREWLYVEDGAEALVRALSLPPQIQPVNVGRGEGLSIAELALKIKEMAGYAGNIIFDASRPDGAPCKIMEVEAMKKVFNWTPPTALDEGIKKTIEWYETNVPIGRQNV
jgi:GDP-L-fucose synthase